MPILLLKTILLGVLKMRLTSVAIINFCSINDFQESSQWTIRASDPNTLYFQLFDLDNVTTTSSPYSNLAAPLIIGGVILIIIGAVVPRQK